MIAVQGYYDGEVFKPLEKVSVKTNQKVIITIMDDFVAKPKLSEEERRTRAEKMRGILSKYAKPNIEEAIKEEDSAWEKAAIEKYGNA